MENLDQSIIKIRVELQNSTINKSGKNKFQGFTYFELKDFLPRLNELMLANGVNDIVSIDNGVMTLTLTNGEDANDYSIPFVIYETPLNKQGGKSMQDIQYLGALNTYYKRYLYLNAFGITDGEVIDGLDNNTTPQRPVTTQPTQPVHQPTVQQQENFQRAEQHQETTGPSNPYQVNGSAPQPGVQMGLPTPTRTCECGHVQVERISGAGNKYYNCELCKSWIN